MEARADLRRAIELAARRRSQLSQHGRAAAQVRSLCRGRPFPRSMRSRSRPICSTPTVRWPRPIGISATIAEAIALFDHAERSRARADRPAAGWRAGPACTPACGRTTRGSIGDTLSGRHRGRTHDLTLHDHGLRPPGPRDASLDPGLGRGQHARARQPAAPRAGDDAGDPGSRDRIRIGYLSADFRGHATAALVSELFRLQDRSRFELFGYNIGLIDGFAARPPHDGGSRPHGRLAGLDDREARGADRRGRIDILVDLKGFTTDSRPGILAYRRGADPGQLPRLSGIDGEPHTSTTSWPTPSWRPSAMQPFFDEADRPPAAQLPAQRPKPPQRRPGCAA